MKQRICSLLLALALCFGLAACGSSTQKQWKQSYDLGVKYLAEGNYEEAVIHFTAAIEIDPKRTDAYIGLADLYVAQGDYGAAISVLQQGADATEGAAELVDYLQQLDQLMQDAEPEIPALPALLTDTEDINPVPTFYDSYYIPADQLAQLLPDQLIAAALTGDVQATLAAAQTDPQVQAYLTGGGRTVWSIVEDVLIKLSSSFNIDGSSYTIEYRPLSGTAFRFFGRKKADGYTDWSYTFGHTENYLYEGAYTTTEYTAFGNGGSQRFVFTGSAAAELRHGEFVTKQEAVHTDGTTGSGTTYEYYENGVAVDYYADETGTLWGRKTLGSDGTWKYLESQKSTKLQYRR